MRIFENRLKVSFFLLISVVFFNSCYKEPEFDFVPSIDFASITKDVRIDQFSGAKKDSIILTINFQDGDGDLGINSDEVGKIVERTDFNYVVKTYRSRRGVFNEFQPQENLSGFFPRLKTDEKAGPIEGKLNYRIQIETAFWPFKKDTVKFEVYIKDRAGNRSNTTESTPIIINEF
jgi:hypothetical protein